MDEFQDLVVRTWGDSAQSYDESILEELNSPLGEVWRSLILKNAPQKTGAAPLRILDIGTGPGFFPVILAKKHEVEVTGIDCTEEMIKHARKNVSAFGTDAELEVMDSSTLDFPDESFDMIINRNVVWTLSNPEKAYSEWARVIRQGGKVLIFDANWQRYYHDEKAKAIFIKHDREYFEKCGEHLDDFIQKKKDPKGALELRVNAPLGKHDRPQWDFDILLKFGFRKFHFDIQIGETVWTEEEKFRYKYAPMFMISAEK
ncbi:MAG: class I SAM-dependent methyltransferase [Synergistaceae bacterium]|nr:class I SAM-dependent methyltransferase [Synergistaceae bacterium]